MDEWAKTLVIAIRELADCRECFIVTNIDAADMTYWFARSLHHWLISPEVFDG